VHGARGSDAPSLASALAAVLRLGPGTADSVEAHLVEARQWVARGDLPGAFASASRALRLAPDQPGIVADVARQLANLGETQRAEQLCERFLRQRPEAAPVQGALAELRATLPS
jgi:predicted Zn-dependent protease